MIQFLLPLDLGVCPQSDVRFLQRLSYLSRPPPHSGEPSRGHVMVEWACYGGKSMDQKTFIEF